MTVAEFIEWLKTQDQGATVEVVIANDWSRGYECGTDVKRANFDPAKHTDYIDFRENKHVTEPRIKDRRFLLLGEMP